MRSFGQGAREGEAADVKSMTGFGRGQAALGEGRVVAELRTVNHRYQDCRLHLPPELSDLEEALDRQLRGRFRRGRVELTIRLRGRTGHSFRLDRELALGVLAELESIRDAAGLERPVSVDVLATLPELFEAGEATDAEGALESVSSAVDQAAAAADQMRQREAEALERDFHQRLDAILATVDQLVTLTTEATAQVLERIRGRVNLLLEGTGHQVDDARLLQEVALIADRADVSEELTRLRSHVEQFLQIATEDRAVGRRLDFLLQEMAREATTIGSKVQNAEMQHLIVELRGEIARLREQVQNIE